MKQLACLLCGIAAAFLLQPTARGFEPVILTNATASYSQLNGEGTALAFPVRDVIDGRIDAFSGWSVFPRLAGVSHSAVFETVQDVGHADGTRFTFVMRQELAGHNLGRVRVAVTSEPRDAFADGAQIDGQLGLGWTVLQPLSVKAATGAKLSIQPDGSVLAVGANLSPETYTIIAATKATNITGIRLEVLPDASLPFGGPGRGPFGNFSLSEFQVFQELDTLTVRAEVSELTLRVSSETNRIYRLQTRGVGDSTWANLGEPLAGTGSDLVFRDREVGATNKLYRVVPSVLP